VRVEEHDDLVSGVERLLHLLAEVVPLLVERVEIGPDPIVSANHIAAERRQVRPPLDVRVELRHQRIQLAAQASGIDPLGGLYVWTAHPRAFHVPTPPSTTCTGCSAPCSSRRPVATAERWPEPQMTATGSPASSPSGTPSMSW
jgi:hypothetical protein